MKKETFKVVFFTGDPVTVRAFNEKEATILAQAQKIKDGLDYVYEYIEGPHA